MNLWTLFATLSMLTSMAYTDRRFVRNFQAIVISMFEFRTDNFTIFRVKGKPLKCSDKPFQSSKISPHA